MKVLKSFLFVVLTLFLGKSIVAQNPSYKDMMQDPTFNFYTVCETADKYFETHDTGKGSGYKGYQRWKAENESKFYPSGDRSKVSQNFVSEQYEMFRSSNETQRSVFPNGWNELGPFDANNITEGYNPGIGRIESFWINPINPQHMYLGSRSGGFWKTLDGGTNWVNSTDYLVASGVNTIAVSPTNSDSVLINIRNGGNASTHGLYRSVDGGDNWVQSNFNPTNIGWGGLGASDRIYVVKYHPTIPNLIFIGTNHGLYRSDDNLQTWTQLLSSADVTEIEFHPTNSNIIYVYDDYYWSNYTDNIMVSSDLGLTFTPSAIIQGNGSASGFISVTPTAPNNVYFASTNGVWKSIDEGSNFTLLSIPTESCRGFSVSDVDSNAMIYGYLNIQASTNGGSIFYNVTAWANTNPGTDYVHADLRTSECINGVFYIGTDGYLAKSSDNGATWYRLNDGTAVREFYASGVSQSNYNIYMAGSQDNGTSVLNENGWIEWNGGDGMEAIVQTLNPDWMMGSWQYGTRQITKDGGQTRQGAGNPDGGSATSAWQAPLLYDPNQQMGIYHFAEKIYKSEDFGSQWYELADPGLGRINVAAVAENNSEIMAISSGNDLVITEDNWVSQRLASLYLPSNYITDIAFDPNRDSTIIVVYNTYLNDGKKVYLSTDLGLTWSNITFNLHDLPIRTVVIDHSDSSYIYLGAEIGIYVKSMNSSLWELYNPNLPNVTVKDLEIQYGSNNLKAATWGRGLWEYHLKDRDDYPAILFTSITNPPTEVFPRAGYDQFVTSVISYDHNITSAFVRWSNDSKELDHILLMTNISDSTWKTNQSIPNFGEGTDIFFKVYVVGQNNDTTETYRFQYEVQQGLNINGVEALKTKDDHVLVYPNPNSGKLTVELPKGNKKVIIKVNDITGKLIYDGNSENYKVSIAFEASPGNYILSITHDLGVTTRKIIIE